MTQRLLELKCKVKNDLLELQKSYPTSMIQLRGAVWRVLKYYGGIKKERYFLGGL